MTNKQNVSAFANKTSAPDREIDKLIYEDKMTVASDFEFKYRWKVLEVKEKHHTLPQYKLYRLVWGILWEYYDIFDYSDDAIKAAKSYEEFMQRESYEKEIWRS